MQGSLADNTGPSVSECLVGLAADMRQITKILDDGLAQYTAIAELHPPLVAMRKVSEHFAAGLDDLDLQLATRLYDAQVRAVLGFTGINGDA